MKVFDENNIYVHK